MYPSRRPGYQTYNRQPRSGFRPPRHRAGHKRLFVLLAVLALVVALFAVVLPRTLGVFGAKQAHKTSAAFNMRQYSLTDPTSIWAIVNKQRQLNPADYAPGDLVNPAIPLRLDPSNEEMKLRAEAAKALKTLSEAAAAQGLHLMLASGYRSYQLQVTVYGAEVRTNGQAAADQESARPGYSEHQTGLAADLEPVNRQCEIATCFANLPEGQWLAANAYKYGFIIRYQQDKRAVTGYTYEPWHVRYIGASLAGEMHRRGISTLEEFFRTGAAPQY